MIQVLFMPGCRDDGRMNALYIQFWSASFSHSDSLSFTPLYEFWPSFYNSTQFTCILFLLQKVTERKDSDKNGFSKGNVCL